MRTWEYGIYLSEDAFYACASHAVQSGYKSKRDVEYDAKQEARKLLNQGFIVIVKMQTSDREQIVIREAVNQYGQIIFKKRDDL